MCDNIEFMHYTFEWVAETRVSCVFFYLFSFLSFQFYDLRSFVSRSFGDLQGLLLRLFANFFCVLLVVVVVVTVALSLYINICPGYVRFVVANAQKTIKISTSLIDIAQRGAFTYVFPNYVSFTDFCTDTRGEWNLQQIK